MTASSLKLAATRGYKALTEATVADYLSSLPEVMARLGSAPAAWKVREVGDGNLNLVFIVTGSVGAVCVKQALPYVRLVGESWPLPLSRAHFEWAALCEQVKAALDYVPALYHHDAPMALTVMEYLTPHIILRKGLISGMIYPDIARHLGEFLGLTLFSTSDFSLDAAEKKRKLAYFADNIAMCKISEDLIFDEPYFDAPMNRHTQGLDDIAQEFRHDTALKVAIQEMKVRFMNGGEAMLHGDLHTGSVMVTESDTRVIDPEFAFYGPMGFDIGAVIANLLLAALAQVGHEKVRDDRADYAEWILRQIPELWHHFMTTFIRLVRERTVEQSGALYHPRVMSPDAASDYLKTRMNEIWRDTLGFTAAKMVRRILGLAHVEDMESIADEAVRAKCERQALLCARAVILDRSRITSPGELIKMARTFLVQK